MYHIGVDLGGTNIAVGVVNNEGQIIHKDSTLTLREREYTEILEDTGLFILKVIKEAGLRNDEISSIGFACPGVPDSREGTWVYANNIKFTNVPIKKELQKYLNVPIFLENDANAAAYAEYILGAAKGARDSVIITLGTGIGGGIIINGSLYSGFNYSGAELGHMVININGEECTCGRKGCWEAYASATALIRQTRAAAAANPDSKINLLTAGDINKIEAKTAFDAAKMGDEVALLLIDQYRTYLAEGMVNVINIFQPEILCIGGGICKQGEYLLKPLREKVFSKVYCGNLIKRCEIKVAQMENDAGIIGAALLGKKII